MRNPRAALIAAVLLATAPCASQPPETPVITAPSAPVPEIIPFDVGDTDRMTVPVHIAGQGPFALIIDTAATRTVIARDLADMLQLAPAGHVNVISLTGSTDEAMVTIPDLTFGTGRARDLRALALNGARLGARGILGLDALQGQKVVLDFVAQTLSVSARTRRAADDIASNEIVVNARRRLGELILADSTIDGERIDVIVDTGTQVSLGNEALRRLLLKDGRKYVMSPITMIGVTGGTLTADYTRADRLRIGQVALIGMPIAFADAYPFRKLRLRRPALLLGMDALKMFARVTVDFANHRATFILRE